MNLTSYMHPTHPWILRICGVAVHKCGICEHLILLLTPTAHADCMLFILDLSSFLYSTSTLAARLSHPLRWAVQKMLYRLPRALRPRPMSKALLFP